MKTNFLIYRHPDEVLLSFQGGLFVAFLIVISALNISVFSMTVSLAWIPLAAIFLWPRWSHPFMTPVIIAVLGVFSDLLLGRFIGLSSLLYLILFWAAKPAEREVQLSFVKSWLEFALMTILLLMISFYFFGRVLDLAVGWVAVIEQVFMVVFLYPLVFLLRALIRARVIDPNDANYNL